jgi:hypothetical protein
MRLIKRRCASKHTGRVLHTSHVRVCKRLVKRLCEIKHDYLADKSKDSVVARIYGWPICVWDVSKTEDFSFLFSSSGNTGDGGRFNPAAENFNEDINGWDVSSAITMRYMFYLAQGLLIHRLAIGTCLV